MSYIKEQKEKLLANCHQKLDEVVDGFFTSKNADFRWLSNFHPCHIKIDDLDFTSVEHAYHAMKTFNKEQKEAIANAATPALAKTLGQKVALRPDWETVKVECMEILLRQKFKKGSELYSKLKSTGKAKLVESNYWHDNFYGECICLKCANKGKNILGELLMKIRDE